MYLYEYLFGLLSFFLKKKFMVLQIQFVIFIVSRRFKSFLIVSCQNYRKYVCMRASQNLSFLRRFRLYRFRKCKSLWMNLEKNLCLTLQNDCANCQLSMILIFRQLFEKLLDRLFKFKNRLQDIS